MVAALTADEVDAIVAYVPVIQTIPEGYEVLHWFGDSHHNHPCCDLVVNEKQLDSHKTSVLKKMITQIEGVLPNVNTENPELMQYIADKYGLTPSQATEAMQHTHFATGLEVAGKKLERKLTDISVTKGYQPRQLRDNEIYLELK